VLRLVVEDALALRDVLWLASTVLIAVERLAVDETTALRDAL
jgi:hypothetical protein